MRHKVGKKHRGGKKTHIVPEHMAGKSLRKKLGRKRHR
jgi:hypothetical protein